MNSLEAIQNQIDAASPILEWLTSLIPVPNRSYPVLGVQNTAKKCYDKVRVYELEEQINRWQYVTKGVLAKYFSAGSEHYREFEHTIVEHRDFNLDAKHDLENEVKNGRSKLSAIIETESLKAQLDNTKNLIAAKKTPIVFISHKIEDSAYAEALVNLINFIIGAEGQKIFCSSVPGYGIRLSGDILDELKAQFDDHDIFMVIIHSPRYYKSAICLNEMGASWALGTKFSSFMTKDCKYEHMHGVIGREKICVNLNDDEKTLNAHLNDFKDDLVDFFGANNVDQNKWENARRRFIDEVSKLTYATKSESDADLFELLYLPAFDHIFELLDIENFQRWAYRCAIGGNTYISAKIYDKLDQVPNYIKSRPKHEEYASWDALMRNLGLLVDDFTTVFSEHLEKLGDDRYTVERFYKRHMNNPNYEEDLTAYNEHVWLVSDMLFELARLGNLILSRIREKYPDYRKELGILHIDNCLTEPDLVYRDNEVSDAPYPGLKKYIKVRLTREKHLGGNPNIDESGYEI